MERTARDRLAALDGVLAPWDRTVAQDLPALDPVLRRAGLAEIAVER